MSGIDQVQGGTDIVPAKLAFGLGKVSGRYQQISAGSIIQQGSAGKILSVKKVGDRDIAELLETAD